MRKLGSLLVVAGLLLLPATLAGAEPPSTDRQSAANYAARWLGDQVTSGAIESAPGTPSPGLTAQAVLALVAAGVGQQQVDAMITYLGDDVDTQVQDSNGDDQPGALAYLILDAVATGNDPTNFGDGGDLVARLDATQQTAPPENAGLYGVQDPTFDGAFRQGLALLAKAAVGDADPEGVDWLVDQQCDDGGWTSYRSDTSQPCPAVDPANFVGEDTNSTALAVLGLQALSALPTNPDPVDFLGSVRTDDGGWAYLADPDGQSDANSTGLVVQALLAAAGGGTPDAQGIEVLRALQVGCDAPVEDRGALAFQDDGSGTLTPNPLATAQALPALAGAFFPLDDRSLAALPAPPNCDPAPAPTTTTTAAVVSGATTTTTAVVAAAGTLPKTGSGVGGLSSKRVARIGIALLMAGTALILLRRRPPEWMWYR